MEFRIWGLMSIYYIGFRVGLLALSASKDLSGMLLWNSEGCRLSNVQDPHVMKTVQKDLAFRV